MKRATQLSNAIALFQARRAASGLPTGNAKTKITDTTFYVVSRVDGRSGIAKLTTNETKKGPGVTNFDGNKLPKGTEAVIDSMKATVAKGGLVLNNVDWNGDNIPAGKELMNAELKLIQGENLLANIPFSDLVLSNDDDNYRDIASTPYIVSETPIEWILEFADGTTVPAELVEAMFIKIECRAIQAIQ